MAERRRKSALRKPDAGDIFIVTEPGSRFSARVPAKLLNTSETGVCIEISKALPLAMALHLELPAGDGRIEQWEGSICWIESAEPNVYRAGIEMQKSTGGATAASNQETEDLYEVLQVNRKSDFDLIHRVYRMLAQRYHPDNVDSGDERKFQNLLAAYEILSSPDKRAAYDVKLATQRRTTWTVFHSKEQSDGPSAERRKRTMALATMYRKRLRQPALPEVTMRELEDVLGLEKEHLEFTLWYLRDRGLAVRSDRGCFSITTAGVDVYENAESVIEPEARKAITA